MNGGVGRTHCAPRIRSYGADMGSGANRRIESRGDAGVQTLFRRLWVLKLSPLAELAVELAIATIFLDIHHYGKAFDWPLRALQAGYRQVH